MAEFQPSNNTISNTYVCSAVTQATHHGQSQLQYGSILHPHTVGAVMSPAALFFKIISTRQTFITQHFLDKNAVDLI